MNILEALKNETLKLQRQLGSVHTAIKILGGKNSVGRHKKRHVSASARAKMSKAQRARWAKVRATKKSA
jgi:hypothetical protein